MKKFLMLVIVVIMLASSACTTATPAATEAPAATDAPVVTEAPAATEAPATTEKQVVAACLPAMDNPLMLGLSDVMTATFGEQYDVQIASADGNANTQATQVQNFAAMNAKFMLVMAVEASSLVPSLKAAREAGSIILLVGGDPGDPDAYDSVMMMNQYLSGYYEAYMAKQWVDATYPDAADGSIETLILESTLNTDATNRSNGIKMIAEPFLKNVNGEFIDAEGNVVTADADKVANPAYSVKVNVVQNVQAEMFQQGQTAMQNALATNPNIKLVLAYAGDGGMGASQAIIDENAKGAASVIPDLSKVAVFGVGMIGPEGSAVMDSGTNKTVFRGTIRFGGDLIARTGEIAAQMVAGEITKVIYDPLDIVTLIDGKLMAQPIEDTEVFRVPTAALVEVLLGPPPGN